MRHILWVKVKIVHLYVNKDGSTTGIHPEKGTLVWHTDKSYTATPSLTTILRSPAIANKGGDTLFADMARAFDELPENTKSKICKYRNPKQ